MADNTPRLDLERFDQGDASWDHTDTVEAVDENAIVHGPIADRPTTGTYDDELYHATDQNITWRWDNTSSDWVHFSGLGSESQRVPGTSHLTDIDVNTLADTALSGQIDTTQLSDDAVTAAKIAAAAVQSEQIATDAVGSAEIATDAVSVDELAAALGTTSSNRVPGTTHFEESSHEALEAGSVNAEDLVSDNPPIGFVEEYTQDGDGSDTVTVDFTGLDHGTPYLIDVSVFANESGAFVITFNGDEHDDGNGNYEFWDETGTKHTSQDNIELVDWSQGARVRGNIFVGTHVEFNRIGIDNRIAIPRPEDVSRYADKGGLTSADELSSIHLTATGGLVDGDKITLREGL